MTIEQGSLFAEYPGRSIGRQALSIVTGDNAALIASIAGLYLVGSVCDVTYGRGSFWKRWRPVELVAHDLRGDGVDFRALPELAATYDAVVFDPPYVPQGGVTDPSASEFRDRYGLAPTNDAALWETIGAGLAECARVVRPAGFVLVKCSDYVTGGRLVLAAVRVAALAERLELEPWDLIVLNRGRPGFGARARKRTKRAHSYLIVLRRSGRR